MSVAHLSYVVIGGGGHATVVADALLQAGARVLGFVTAPSGPLTQTLLGLPLLGDEGALAGLDPTSVRLVNGIGSTGADAADPLRRRVQQRLESDGWQFASVLHPAATISPHARIDAGAQVLAGAIVQACAHIAEGTIVNTRAVVEHHARIGAFTHVAPGAVICGQVEVGEACHVGAGASLRQGIRLGAHVVVGLGAAVIADVPAGVVVGVPARPLEKKK